MEKKKRKLTRNGVQYFDAGGTVVPSPATGQNPAAGAAGSPIINPGNYLAPGIVNGVNSFAAPVNQSVQGIANNVGGIAQGIGSAFTTQNGYQAGLAPTSNSDFGGVINNAAVNSQRGNGQFGQNLNDQQILARTLMNQANGVGWNPAQAQLANATGANVANTNALIGSSRGAGANAGLIARQAAMAGAGVQQNAAGQAAALQAEQGINAENQLSGLYGQIGSQITGEQGVNNNLFSAAAGAQNGQNNTSVNNYGMAQGINSQVAQNNANAVNKTTGGLLNGGGGMLSSLLAKGGEVGKAGKPVMMMPSHLKDFASIYHPHVLMADGGAVPVPNLMSPPDKSPGALDGVGSLLGVAMAALSKGGSVEGLKAAGGGVPGKAKKKGDSYSNDTVSTMLSPGEVVIPRSVMESDDPAGNAAKFVEKLKGKYQKGPEHDDFKKALQKQISSRKGGARAAA